MLVILIFQRHHKQHRKRVLDPRGSVVLIHAISLSPALDASLPEMRGPILV